MLIEERLKELKDKINEKVPSGITVSDVEFEGPELVIYTDDPKRFADEADLIRVLARDLRKRIVVRRMSLKIPRRRSGISARSFPRMPVSPISFLIPTPGKS